MNSDFIKVKEYYIRKSKISSVSLHRSYEKWWVAIEMDNGTVKDFDFKESEHSKAEEFQSEIMKLIISNFSEFELTQKLSI